ncbi:MAG: response regulator [Thermomicrobiales bacterium]
MGTAPALAPDPSVAATVLVVDDEPSLRQTLEYTLRREGFVVATAADGREALELARRRRPDVIVLDIMLPGMDGLQVCRTLRAESTVPILLLSARGEEIDRVLGLELGADDYLTKPFAMRELVARVRAMLRRARMASSDGAAGPMADRNISEASGPTFVAGELSIDVPRRQVSLNGQVVALKPKEFDLLAYLAKHAGIVLSRDALLREVWGYDFPIDTRTVDVHVRWLRQKLETEPSQPKRIETVRGHGYRFVPHGG